MPLYLASKLHDEEIGIVGIPEEVTKHVPSFRIESHHEMLILPEWIYKWIVKIDFLIASEETENLVNMLQTLCGKRILAIISRIHTHPDFTLRNALQPEERRIYDWGVRQCHDYREYRQWGINVRVKKQKERIQKRRREEQVDSSASKKKNIESNEKDQSFNENELHATKRRRSE